MINKVLELCEASVGYTETLTTILLSASGLV
jgi:hypothetical protein